MMEKGGGREEKTEVSLWTPIPDVPRYTVQGREPPFTFFQVFQE